MMNQVISHTQLAKDRLTPQLQGMGEIELNVAGAPLELRHAILVRTPKEQANGTTTGKGRKGPSGFHEFEFRRVKR
jgi:hypothetical protein